MSVPNPRKGTLVAVTLGILGTGCEPAEHHEEYETRNSPSNYITEPTYTQGWLIDSEARGTVSSDEFLDVVVRSTQGTNEVFVAGYENGQLGLTSVDPSGSATRGVIYKFSSNSTNLEYSNKWNYGASNNITDVIEAITLDSSNPNRVYFTGRSTGTAGDLFDTTAGWLDTNTSQYRLFKFADTGPQHPRRLALTKVGDQVKLIIGGYDDNHVIGNYLSAREDPFVQMLHLTKDTQENDVLVPPSSGWTPPPFNTQAPDLALGMCVDGSSIYHTGGAGSGTDRGMFVRKYEFTGNQHVWQDKPSTISLDMVSAAVMDPSGNGNVLVAGSTYANLQRQYGDQDAMVRSLTSTGQVNWTYQYGSTGPDWVTDMTVDKAGNIYLVGETLGSFDPDINRQDDYDYDLWVLKLTPDKVTPGVFQRQVFQIGSPGDDHPSAVAVDDTGMIYVVGYTAGKLLPGVSDEEFQAYGPRQGFVLQLKAPSLNPPGI